MLKFKYWNLLRKIRGDKPFPFSRWLTTSMQDKIAATAYTIFVALCWLTLGIFILNYHLLHFCIKVLFGENQELEDKALKKVFSAMYIIPFLIINNIGEIAIFAATMFLTLALLPIVALIHLASLAIRSIKLNSKDVQQMNVRELDDPDESSYITMHEFFKKNEHVKMFDQVEVFPWASTSELHLTFKNNNAAFSIDLTKENEKGVDELAKTVPKVLTALNSINYYGRKGK